MDNLCVCYYSLVEGRGEEEEEENKGGEGRGEDKGKEEKENEEEIIVEGEKGREKEGEGEEGERRKRKEGEREKGREKGETGGLEGVWRELEEKTRAELLGSFFPQFLETEVWGGRGGGWEEVLILNFNKKKKSIC